MGGCGAVPAPNGCCCDWAVGEQLLSDDALLKWDNDFSISCSFRIFSCLLKKFRFLNYFCFYIEISLKLLCCCSCCPTPSASTSRAILFAGCSFSVLLVIISIFLKIIIFIIFPCLLQWVLIVHPSIAIRLRRTRVWRHVAGRRHQHCRMAGWHST